MSGGGGGAPCGACKFLRRKCVSGCIFAPYFDSDQGAAHFAAVHKIFGASNVSKLLQNIPVPKRCEAVVTICYEAQARLRDPVYGCVGHIYFLQHQVKSLQSELANVQAQLATRLQAAASLQQAHHHGHSESCLSSAASTGYAGTSNSPYDHHHHHQLQDHAVPLSMSFHVPAVPASSSAAAATHVHVNPYTDRLKEESAAPSSFHALPYSTHHVHSLPPLQIEPGNFCSTVQQQMQDAFLRNRNNIQLMDQQQHNDSDQTVGGELQALAHELLRRNHGAKPHSTSS